MAGPGARFCTECQTIQTGWAHGPKWVTAAGRRYARIWCQVAISLDEADDKDVIVWMPAHTTMSDVGVKVLSTGAPLRQLDRKANAEADRLAKLAAKGDRVARQLRKRIIDADERLTAVAKWLGQSTA